MFVSMHVRLSECVSGHATEALETLAEDMLDEAVENFRDRSSDQLGAAVVDYVTELQARFEGARSDVEVFTEAMRIFGVVTLNGGHRLVYQGPDRRLGSAGL